jgi:hypothetical protein
MGSPHLGSIGEEQNTISGGWATRLDSFAYMGLSMVALLAPSYNDLAFNAAQPAVFAELAVMLWLITVGVRAPATERHAMPAATHG